VDINRDLGRGEALDYICSHAGVWRATGWEIVQHFLAQQPEGTR
jgi:hypothetical protein